MIQQYGSILKVGSLLGLVFNSAHRTFVMIHFSIPNHMMLNWYMNILWTRIQKTQVQILAGSQCLFLV